MRLAVILAMLTSAVPVAAACRLSPDDCTTLYRAMTEEGYAAIDDEQHYRPAGLSRSERSVALVRRHLERVDERNMLLPDRIADEWMRLEACGTPALAATVKCR